MRILLLLLVLFLAPSAVFSQLPDEGPNRRQPTNNQQQALNLLEGFAESSWGESYTNLREKFLSLSTNPQNDEKVEIVFEDKEKTLLIRRNGILYSYRFYSTPKLVLDSRPKGQTQNPTAENKSELEEEGHSAPGILFSVGVVFRYLPGKDVQQKLEQKYGKPKKEAVAENKIGGAVLWEKTDEKQSPPRGGFIVQWKEAYKKMPFTRRVDYFSSSVKFQIEKEYKEFFSAEEIKTLRDLIP
ncbi:hypothetical protein EHQ12_04565 [Leptospira gomenensis]|uniref:TNF family profile domain-containing protein n=1 Tax=Leptospira gomenensis TaxID=2484974 RepID=A0A5F1YS77_9LEPT|nr:hypothetical protein [Leptospira gomenensis]TGK38648.1 hypothetical protein EHQ17_00995 [Leptospira gomenensis]TGK42885.1 hypothetical protein EHQ12_04565 [Leptospira gomenensis]TGK49570.1 hypothetical protein EHQ07_04610 [Leptospira gomenensis]TGK60760.1 hypothetical protein EHQ13_10460 [Leptospira gomenensis]